MVVDGLVWARGSSDLSDLVLFWTRIMGKHAHFAAHLLDPVREQALSEQARQLGRRSRSSVATMTWPGWPPPVS